MDEEKEELPEPHRGMTPHEKGMLFCQHLHKKQPFRRKDGTRLDFSGADLEEANFWVSYLQGVNLQGANLRKANLKYSTLPWANLQEAILWMADLQWADLQGADLQRAKLQRAILRGANLQGAILREANLQEAILREANLQGVDLQETDLRGANLLGVTGTPSSRRSARLSAETYTRSAWMPGYLVDWLRADAILEDFASLPPDVQEYVLAEREGLTLRFRTTLTPIDRLMLDAVIAGYHFQNPGSNVRLVEFRERGTHTLVRLLAPDPLDLAAIAEALYARAWESAIQSRVQAPAPEAEHTDLVKQVTALTNPRMVQQLSWLVSRGEVFELWTVTNGVLEKAREWKVEGNRCKALLDLLLSLFTEPELRHFVRFLPDGGEKMAAYLPGGSASLGVVAEAAVEQLEKHGRIDADLFARLLSERAHRREDIAFAAHLWGIELPPPLVLPG